MYWLQPLYLGESVKDREKEIRRKLHRNSGITDVFILSLAESPSEQIDIIPAFVLKQRRKEFRELHIFGLAGGREEAFELVRAIAEETYRLTGDADMRTFLSAKAYEKGRR